MHLIGPWRVVCVQEGAGFVTDSSLVESFYVNHPAPLRLFSSTRTPLRATSHARRSRSLLAQVLFVGRRGHGLFPASSARTPDPSCAYFTVANVHINKECAKRRSCLHRVVHEDGRQRRISPLEAAFNCANIPWLTFGVTPPWGPGGEPSGGTWPECCGFCRAPCITKQVANYAPQVNQCRPGGHRAEDERTKPGTMSSGFTFKVTTEDCAAQQQVNDRRRASCASHPRAACAAL